MYAKKSLGQHFLKSERALRAIIEAGEIKPTDTILEIGPGTGALTERLLSTGAKIIAVEKDDMLSLALAKKYPTLELAQGDILDFDPPQVSYKLIANIPYNITGAILEKFLSAEHQPERMVLLVQDEVAKRIVAKNKKESILSISIKAYGTPRYIDKVLAGSFVPAPKVNSAVILIEDISKDFFKNISEKNFFMILKAGFQAKRKKFSSNLALLMGRARVAEVFGKLGLDKNLRAEDVDIEMWRKLSASLN